MKKFLILAIVLIVFGSLSAKEWISFDSSTEQEPKVNVVETDNNRLILDIEVPGMYLEDVTEGGQTYQKIEIIQGRTTHDVGFPELPMITRIVGIPDNQNVRVRVLNTSTIELNNYNIYPLQTPEKDGVENNNPFVSDSKFYQTGGNYPSTNAFVDNVGIWRDVKIGGFHFVPFNFDAGTGTLQVTTSARIEVEFYGYDNEHVLNKDKIIAPSFYNMYDSALINFESMGYQIDNTREIGVKYLIVTNTNALESIQPLVDYKHKEGYSVEVRTLETGFETATEIKDYIMQLYDTDDLEYVLMVGDAYPNGSAGPDNVPMYLWSGGGGSSWSDSWYSCMEGNTDYYADIAIGRITYDNLLELDHQILKLTDFYQTPDQTTNWGENSILVAHNQEYPGKYTLCKQQINDFDYAIQTPIFELCYGGAGATNTDIINWVNDTSGGIFNYRGHGSATAFTGWGASNDYFDASEVAQLTNDNRNFVLFDVCCDNMDIVGHVGDCLAESFMKADEAAIAINGAIVPSYTIPNHDYDKEMYKAIFNEGITTIGYITNYANIFVINLHGNIGIQNVLTYLWLGDSSIEPWTKQIGDLTVTHDAQLFLGMSTFDVSVMGTNGPMENARVCVSNDDGTIYAVAFTDASGIVQVQFDEPVQSPGTASVSAKAFNYLRYNADIQVIPQEGPYCVYNANTINDDSGNSNGLLDYGESVLLTLDIENVGVMQAGEVIVEIASADPYVTITDNEEVYGDIEAGSIVSVTDGFAFTVAGSIPDGHYIMFDVVASSSALNWSSTFSLESHAPDIAFLEFVVNDTAFGNGDYMWDPGEEVEILVTLENAGSSFAFNVEGDLSTTDPYVTLNTTTTQLFGDLNINDTADAVFNATSNANTPEAHLAGFIIDFTADLGIAGSGSFETQIGGYLIEEYFETFPPTGWTTAGGTNWGGGSTNNAGGTSPEAHFYWSPSTTAAQRMISQVINTTGNASLSLSFQHMVDDYGGGYSIKVQTTSDGTNWNDVWSINPNGNVGPEFQELVIATPDVGSSTFQIAWVFDGNSFQINNWYVDDIILGGGTVAVFGIVEGFVTDSATGLPIENADIAGMATSAADGSYTFDIAPGVYPFTCTADGYYDLTIEDVLVEENLTTDLNFALVSVDPPTNVEAITENYNDVVITWEAPAADITNINNSASKIIKNNTRSNVSKKSISNDDSRNLMGYEVYRDGSSIGEITDPAILTYTDEGLNADEYDYYVIAVYDDGDSEPSNTATVEVILPAPANLTAVSQNSNVYLEWDAISALRDFNSYSVYRDGMLVGEDISNTFYLDTEVTSGETYIYNTTAVYDGGWESEYSNDAEIMATISGGILIPLVTELEGNYPNPFNPTTVIKFGLSEAASVTLEVYNIKGEKVRTLINSGLEAKYHTVTWNGKDDSRKNVSSGVYFYKMKAGSYTSTKKMIMMK
jgi:Peptidase family C25/Propeptide_C25/Carboxypeptidase regulatory-like domain/Secretion system C-terminal sorting domain/Peptidase family C25, C terminal ig-like domain